MANIAEIEKELLLLNPTDRARLALVAWESVAKDPEAATDPGFDPYGLALAQASLLGGVSPPNGRRMNPEFHPDSILDLNEAVEFYEREQSGLGAELRIEIYGTLDRIVEDPYRYRTIRHHRQRPEMGEDRQ